MFVGTCDAIIVSTILNKRNHSTAKLLVVFSCFLHCVVIDDQEIFVRKDDKLFSSVPHYARLANVFLLLGYKYCALID
jgi:hypothetical protein